MTAPLPLHGSRGRGSQDSRARTSRRLRQAERCDEPRADRLSRNAGTVRRLAFSPPLSSAASARSCGHGVPSNGAGRRLGRRDRSGHELPYWGRSASRNGCRISTVPLRGLLRRRSDWPGSREAGSCQRRLIENSGCFRHAACFGSSPAQMRSSARTGTRIEPRTRTVGSCPAAAIR
jgi:hypothetical protein